MRPSVFAGQASCNTWVTVVGQQAYLHCNGRFSETFYTGEQFRKGLRVYQVIPEYIWGRYAPHAFSLLWGPLAASDSTVYIVRCSMIAEEDWPAFYEALADVMFKSRCKSSSVVVKVRKDIHMGSQIVTFY